MFLIKSKDVTMSREPQKLIEQKTSEVKFHFDQLVNKILDIPTSKHK